MKEYKCSFCGELVVPLKKDKKGVMIHDGRPYTVWSSMWDDSIICYSCVRDIKDVMGDWDIEDQTS